MKRIFGIVLLIVGSVVWGSVNVHSVKKLRSYPTAILQQEAKVMQMTIDASSVEGIAGSSSRKNELQKEKYNYEVEIARRMYMLDWFSVVLVLFGLGLFSLSFFSRQDSRGRKRKVRVTEIMPSEVYVDEAEFFRRGHDAFLSKEEALLWFENDPLKTCSYCGSNAVMPVKGMSDEIQLVTFYKKVPSSAKDLRIVYGSMWFVRPAAELQCESCNQRVLR